MCIVVCRVCRVSCVCRVTNNGFIFFCSFSFYYFTFTSSRPIKQIPFGNGGGVALLATLTSSIVHIQQFYASNNTAERGGGAIYCEGSTAIVSAADGDHPSTKRSFFGESNKAKFGGNIMVVKSVFNTTSRATPTATMMKHFFFQNSTSSNDGGSFACIGSTLHVEQGEISTNAAKLKGGGIYGVLCQLELVDSIVRQNKAGYDGGGVYIESLSAAAILSTGKYGMYIQYCEYFTNLVDKPDIYFLHLQLQYLYKMWHEAMAVEFLVNIVRLLKLEAAICI